MKKYRINDILGDNNGSQQQIQQNGVENRQTLQPLQGLQPLQSLQSLQGLQVGQRFQLTQNIQNRIQRRYEADGSEEEEMRANQLLHQSIGSQSLQSLQSLQSFGPQRNMNCVSSDEHIMNNMDSNSGNALNASNASNASNSCNIDATTLYSKLKELQEAEARLKQVEDLMRSIEKMENNIKEVKRDSIINNDSRKTSNENQTKFMSRNSGNNITHNVSKSSAKSVSTQPKQLSHSSNNICVTNAQQKNIIPRNMDENNSDLNTNTTPQLLSQTMDLSDNNMGYSTDLDESESTSEESFNLINGNLIRSMRSQFDSMRSQFETMLPVLENQFTNTNTNTNNNNNMNMNNNYMNNQQFFHLMLLQNYQIMQQQQMLLLWLQQQQQQQPIQPIQQQPQQHPSPNPQHYFNSRQSNISSIPATTLHYRNSTRNNEVNSHSHNMTAALNNQVVPGVRANNYWDNFKSYSRQNKLSASTNSGVNSNHFSSIKGNENLLIANNHMVSPLIGSEQQLTLNTNQSQDLNSSASPTFAASRHSYKAANASHVQCVEHVEKQQNLPINDVIHSKSNPCQQLDSNNFAALFSMLEKLIENDDKYVSKSATKKKSTNLVITADEEEDGIGIGAVGGIGVLNVVNNQMTSEESNESKCLPSQQATATTRPQLSGALAMPLHIPASSGAIRKKPRNQEILELTSKTENSESFVQSMVNGSEMIRPLMPAEGRSSEINISNTTVAAVVPNSSSQQQKAHLLAIRPPTTGATGYKDCDSGSNVSSDDDLAEADQTASELITSESETIYNNNSVNTISAQTANVQVLETVQRSVIEDNNVITNVVEDEEEEEEDDTILANSSNESGIRLSGDGEQGL